MEAPILPREASPMAAPVLTTGKKRKHTTLGTVVSAASPAPSDGAETPNPANENVVLSTRHLDLASRPRLTISRHPVFVPAIPGSHYYTTEPLCNNRLNFRYTPAGISNPGSVLPFRTIESAPAHFRVSWEDRSPFVKVTQDGLGLKGERGFRSARCNAPVREGKWYMEVKIDLGGGDKAPDSKMREGSHVRLGWGRRESPLNAPAGLDGYSYAIRDKSGEKVHLSRPRPYGKPFESGDVIGMYISLPTPSRQPNKRDPYDPAHIKRERIAIEFKGQEYFESFEYSQSKEMITLMESKEKGKASSSTPAPSATKKSATVKNLPTTSRGTKTNLPEPTPMRALPTLGPESCIAFFINGTSQGVAFRDLYDYLPLRAPQNKTQEKKRGHRDGLREHKENPFDDGSLGYYPLISLFNEAKVTINPGPDFEYPPPPDIDAAIMLDGALESDIKPHSERRWRPLCERYPEYMAEQFALDEAEEAEAQKNQQLDQAQEQTVQEKLEVHRAKRRAQAAARKEKRKKEEEERTREEKRRRMEQEDSEGAMQVEAIPNTDSLPHLGTFSEASISRLCEEGSPIPTGEAFQDTSEYNTEYEDVNGDGEDGGEGTKDQDANDELTGTS